MNVSNQQFFEKIYNFRDLGGYTTHDSRTVSRRKLYRSGSLHQATPEDVSKLKTDIGLRTILDLRSTIELESSGMGLPGKAGFRYYNVSLIKDGGEREANIRRYKGLNSMGEFYFRLLQQTDFASDLIRIFEILADPQNYPLVFHCSAGKDRTGIITAIVLDILGVSDSAIIRDYCLTALHPNEPFNRADADVIRKGEKAGLPAFFWQVTPEIIRYFLDRSRELYRTFENYVITNCGDSNLLTAVKQNLSD